MGGQIARLGDTTSHGGTIISASDTRSVDGIAVARIGDMVSCPISGHGVNPIVSVQTTTSTDSRQNAHIGASTACGSVIVGGSPDLSIG